MTVNDSGETLNEFTFDGDVDIVRSANIAGAEEAELLAYQHWGTVAAHDSNGDKLWVYSDGQGVDDVCAHDLDGDGLDEVVVGYGGATGLHALDHAGNLLWKDTDMGNVWHVSAGDVNGDGSPDVVTTSATGKLHIFGASGEKLQDLDPGFYAKLVRLAHVADEDEAMTILAAGPDGDMLGLVALDGVGSRRWITHLEAAGINYPISGEPAPGRPWFAIAVSGGWVYVVDVTNGEVVASASDQGMKTQVGWLAGEAGEAPLLLAATGDSLNAFHVPDE